LISPIFTITSVLIVVSSASRLILFNNIIREDDRRADMVRTTHQLIAITKDLQQKIFFLKGLLSSTETSIFALNEVSKSIQSRYESLYEQ
jgi:hypothetical protein